MDQPILTPDPETLLLEFRNQGEQALSRLRIGVAVPASESPRWVNSLLRFLGGIPGFEVFPISLSAASQRANPSWLTDRLYAASKRRFDPFRMSRIDSLSDLGPAFREACRGLGCDVVIWLADGGVSGGCADLAKCAVFTVRLGRGRHHPPYWDEAAAGQEASEAAIYWHAPAFERGRAVRRAEVSTRQGLHFTLNAEEPLLAVMRLLAGLCLEVQREGAAWAADPRRLSIPEEACEPREDAPYPSTFDSARFAIGKLARSARLRLEARGRNAAWFVALRGKAHPAVAGPGAIPPSGFQPVPLPPGSRMIADPFLLELGERTWMLFEEIPSGLRKGRLCCAEVADGRLAEMAVVLEREHHLSYPCVVRDDAELFLIPESSGARRIDLYRFTRFPSGIELVSTLAEGLRMVDTTPFFLDGRWYFFTTTVEPFLETFLFWSDRLEGPLRLHPASPISCSVRNSRSAGNLYYMNGRLFRPTQDCSVRYGYAITLNEVTKLTPREFEEHAADAIPPTWLAGLLGTHTWNESSKFQVIDGIRFQ